MQSREDSSMAKATRRSLTGGGWRQFVPLIPVAVFATAFSIQATADDPAVANDGTGGPVRAGGGVVVPSKPIDTPAHVPVPGEVGNGIPRDAHATQVVSGLSRNGIPQAALLAYARAQQVMAQVDSGCNLPWTLVAAIGRVESNHGRHGGNVLRADGLAVPGIFGPVLNGAGAARISDTDGGSLDGDATFDRAVGPMQFIPGTWRAVGVDGDGDGTKNPQDIDDAAMSTAVYLCAGNTDLADPSDLNAAILRYNHSQAYVDMVIRIAQAYARGAWTSVENGRPEDAYQGVYPAKGAVSRTGTTPTSPSRKPAQQGTASGSTDTGTSRPSTQSGTSEPSTSATSKPRIPTALPNPPVRLPSTPTVPAVQTAVGSAGAADDVTRNLLDQLGLPGDLG
jgi:Transglycosylase SLT domain